MQSSWQSSVVMASACAQVGYVLQGSQGSGGGSSGYGAQRSYDQGSNYSQRYRPY